tara:strand:- start:369 stop:1904 length:1536 start_codon:yes stop_codon:yes gene_type:complete
METDHTGIDTSERHKYSEPKHLGNLNFDNTYSRLPEIFFQEIAPKPVSDPKLVRLNTNLAKELGMDPSTVETRDLDILAGNAAPLESKQIAMVYAGHQFGNWVPRLGDGRAVLLGEVIDTSGARRDIQLKGSGPTLFSRMGDGRASVGPVIREYLVSEGMAALQIPTTRSLAIVTTGELIARERMEPGAILTRVASSHIRVGTFQYFYGQRDDEAIRLLADYSINRHYPNAGENPNPYVEFLRSVVEKTAELISSWMLVGFIHGVMNTDNSSIAGETIDYGPCAFMDAFDANKVFSSIDTGGRYAYNQQPAIGLWNLSRFAETLLGIIDSDKEQATAKAREVLETYWQTFEEHFHFGLCQKIGLEHNEENLSLAFQLLDFMSETKADFTNTFRNLPKLITAPEAFNAETDNKLKLSDKFSDWSAKWTAKIAGEVKSVDEALGNMNKINPLFIPRNHQIQRVIDFAIEAEDYEPLEQIFSAVTNPFGENPQLKHLSEPPKPEEEIKQTFCGT